MTNRESREHELEQQRQNRATLLRDHERTTLTRANFCALKGVPESDLDALLEMARREADERTKQMPHAVNTRPGSAPRPERHGRPPREPRPRR